MSNERKPMKPETQAAIAAEMARMQGWRVLEYNDPDQRPPNEIMDGLAILRVKPPGEGLMDWQPFLFHNQAIAFADWAEREGKIAYWERLRVYSGGQYPWTRQVRAFRPDIPEGRWSMENVELTPTTFPHALSLAVARAIPELRTILEADDAD